MNSDPMATRRQLSALPATAALLLACALLAACGGGGGGDGATSGGPTGAPPSVGFPSVQVSGTTDTVATVTVNGVADADGSEDTAWRAVLPMDGTALPAVSGTTYDGTITVTATDTEALTATTRVRVSIAP